MFWCTWCCSCICCWCWRCCCCCCWRCCHCCCWSPLFVAIWFYSVIFRTNHVYVYIRCFHFNLMTFVFRFSIIQTEMYCLIQFQDDGKKNPFCIYIWVCFCCCFLLPLFRTLLFYLFILSFMLPLKQPYKLKLICLAEANSLNVIGWEKWFRHSKKGR